MSTRRWIRPRPEPELPLFAPPANRAATSQAAAASIVPHRRGQLARVLDALRLAGDRGRTNEELAELLGMRIQSVAARRAELVAAGRARVTRETRRTSSGRAAAVIVAVAGGEARP